MPPPRRFLQSGAVNTAEGSIIVQLSFSSSSSSASLEPLFSFVCRGASQERKSSGANDKVGSDPHHRQQPPPPKRFPHQTGRRRMEITVPSVPIKKGAVTLAGWNKILTVLAESVFASCSGDDAESNKGNDLTSPPSTTLDGIADRREAFLAFLTVVPTATTTTAVTAAGAVVVAPSSADSAVEEVKVQDQQQQQPEKKAESCTGSSSGDAAKKRLVHFFAKGGSATSPPPPSITSTTAATSTEEAPNSSAAVASATTATPSTAAAAVVACSEGAVWLDLATNMVVMGNLQDGWTVRWENMASMLHEAFVGSSAEEGEGEHENNNTSSVRKNQPDGNLDATSGAVAGEDHKRLVRVLQGHGVSSLISQHPQHTPAELAKAVVIDGEGNNTPHVAPLRPAAPSARPIMRRVAIAFDEVMLLHESPLSRVPETPLRYQRALEAFLNAVALPQLPLDLYLQGQSSLPSNSVTSSTNKSTTADHQSNNNNDKNNTEMCTSLPSLPDVCFSTKPFEEWLSDSTLCLLTSSSQATTTTTVSRSSAKSAAACVSFDELLRLPCPIKRNDPLPNRKGKPFSPPAPRMKEEGEMEEEETEMKNDDACIGAEERYLPLRVVKRLLEPLWGAALKAIQPLVQQQQQQPDHNGDPPAAGDSADVTTHRRGPTGRPSRSVSPTTRGSHRHPSHSLATLLLRDCVVRWPSRLAHDSEITEGPLLPPPSSSSFGRSNILGCSKPNESAKKEEEQEEKGNEDTHNNRATSYVRSESPLKENEEQQGDTTILQAHDMAQYASFLHEGTSLLDHVAPAQRKTDVYCSSTALPQSVLERKSIPPMTMVPPRASSSSAAIKKTDPVTMTPNTQPSCQTAETEANITDTTAVKPSGRGGDEATGGSVVENEPCSPSPPPPPTASLKHSGSSLAVRCAVAAAIDLVLAVYFGSEEEDENATQSEMNSTATTSAASPPLATAESERRLPPEMAFALIRPPGHHCSHNVPGGFCLVNNVVLAIRALQQEALARYQQRARGASSSSSRSALPFQKPRVAILDLDVHHGEGTQALVEQDPSILFLSVHRHDHGAFYPYSKVEGTAAYRGPHKTVWNVPVQTFAAAAHPVTTPGTAAHPQPQDSAIAQVAPSSSPSEKEDLPTTNNNGIQPPPPTQQDPAGVGSSSSAETTTTTSPPAVHRVLSDSLLREAWCHIIEPALQEFQPDLILVSLGFDAAFGDPLGGSAVVRGYEDFFRALAAFVDDTKTAAKRLPKEPRGQQQQRCGGDENPRESRSDVDDDDDAKDETRDETKRENCDHEGDGDNDGDRIEKTRRVCRGVVAVLEGGYHPQVVAQQSLAVLRSMLWRDPLSSSCSSSCCTASENGRHDHHHHRDRSCSFSSASSMVWPIEFCVPPPTLVTASSSPPVLVGSKNNNNSSNSNNSNSNKSLTLQERWNNHLQWASEEIKLTAEQLFSSS